jgi:hypothetical protein
MKASLTLWAAGLLMAVAVPVLAHHSFDAEYDRNKPIKVTGTVTKLEWMNPHIWFYMDVKDDAGNITHWQCEGGAPNSLRRNGWNRESLKPGETITVDGSLAKDGSKTINARSVILADGKKVFAGSSEGNSKE